MKEISNLSYFDPLIPFLVSIGREKNECSMFAKFSLPNWFKINLSEIENYFTDVHFTYNEQEGYTGFKGTFIDDKLAHYFISASSLPTK